MLRTLLITTALCGLLAQGAQAATYALVVGVDEYPNDVSLDGAVKDAEDVARALQGAGVARIAKFINAEARKADIRKAWDGLLAEAVEGDTLVFTYAGHGSQMPQIVDGDEEDGLDEFLQLPGFDRNRAEETSSEIIVDNELNEWLKLAEGKGLRVLFVSDSCHSGGMSRSVRGKSRLAPAITVKLKAPSAEAVSGASIREGGFQQVTVLAASLESQPTPEVMIGGEARGALSWSFARALEGNADRNGDGEITRVELEDYVFPTVKSQSEALQVPNFTPQVARSNEEVVVRLTRSATAAGQNVAKPGTGKVFKSVKELGWLPAIALEISGSSMAFQNIGANGSPYRWDAASGAFFTPNGDVAGENITEQMAQGVVDKFVVLEFLKAMASQNPGQVSLKPVKDIYAAGDRISFDAPGSAYKNMVVFNLANTGDVQLLDVQVEGTNSQAFKLQQLEVVKPFGADHLIVIATNEPVDAIAAALSKPGVTAATLLQLLPQRLDGSDTSIAIQPLYTRSSL